MARPSTQNLIILQPKFWYLLYDQFITAHAAGAVNGTPAEPTGQTRTVTDTNSKLTITGGVASFATGGAGSGDPAIWYPSMTTILGRLIMGTVVPGDANGNAALGWDANTTGIISQCIRLQSSSVINVVMSDGAGSANVALYSSGVTYTFVVIQRTAGFWFFIKGGAFTNWTLIWASFQGAPGLWFPAVGAWFTASIFTAGNIRIPVNLYIPTPLAYDTFTRANGVLGSTEQTGPDGQILFALTWNFSSGVWVVSTNKAVGTPALGSNVIVNGGFGADTDWTKGSGWAIAAGAANAITASSNLSQTVAPLTASRFFQVVYTVSAFAAGTVQAVVGGKALPTHAANATYTEVGLATTTAFLFTGAGFTGSLDNVTAKALTTADLFASLLVSTADVIADVAVTLSAALGGVPAGLVLNLDSVATPANFVLVYLDGVGNCVIAEFVAGVATVKQTTAVTYSAGAVLRAERSGTECRAFYNNAAVGSAQTMTANTNKNHGLFSTSALNSLDTFTVWPRGTSGEYEGLSSF